MRGHDLSAGIAENYRSFAVAARGRSPQYTELALAVAGDARLKEFLAAWPAAKRQPNLLFAAAWLSNEGPGILPGSDIPGDAHRFVLMQDGRLAVARTDSHGTWVEWLC